MKEKIGEHTGKRLFSVDGRTWFSTPEMAQKAYDNRQSRMKARQEKAA
jgi:hypothetical protein